MERMKKTLCVELDGLVTPGNMIHMPSEQRESQQTKESDMNNKQQNTTPLGKRGYVAPTNLVRPTNTGKGNLGYVTPTNTNPNPVPTKPKK